LQAVEFFARPIHQTSKRISHGSNQSHLTQHKDNQS